MHRYFIELILKGLIIYVPKDVDMNKALIITKQKFEKQAPVVFIAVERLPKLAFIELEMSFNKDKHTSFELH